MKRLIFRTLSSLCFVASVSSALGQSPLEQAITAKYTLTKPTADHSDIVTAGAVLVLKKDGIVMFATDAPVKSQLIYKDGRVQSSAGTKMSGFKFLGQSSALLGHPTSNIVQRTFVAGEKLWLIGVQTVSDGVQLTLMSDAINNVRYQTNVKFPFPKSGPPPSDAVLSQVAEVIVPDESSDKDSSAAPAQAPAPAPAPAPMADIPPPPPPADAPAAPPVTLDKGQTKDQVVASFGQPQKVVKLGNKEIDYYKDMKVTYVGGKVADVE